VPRSILTYLFFVLVLLAGCNRKTERGVTEGRIEFQINYEQEEIGGFSASLLPSTMIMEFKDNMVKNTIQGGMGFFDLANISDLNKNRFITYLKFIDKRYILVGNKYAPPCCFGLMSGMDIDFTKQTKEILGFGCKKAIASFPGDSIESFDIWYTEDMQLLEFNTIMGNANMHMVATKYEVTRIPSRTFDLPKNYTRVSKPEMETILNALLD
jgi:hypothetical protein